MPSLFEATIVGHLGDDAQIKSLPSGKQIAEMSVAVSQGSGDAKKTTWIRVGWWAPTNAPEWWFDAVNALKKSALVTVIADRLEIQTWKDKGSGEPRAALQVTARTVIGPARVAGPPKSQPQHSTMRASDLPAHDPNDVPF